MKRFVKAGMLLAAMAVLLSSCNCYKQMSKKADDIRATATPELLSLKGSSVTADVQVTFAPKYFHKKALMRITPVLVFEGGEIPGTPKYVQGEKVKDNYTVISKSFGGSYNQTITFPYDERARISDLVLRVEVVCGKNSSSQDIFAPVKEIVVAQGISTIQSNANWGAGFIIMPNNFKRVTTISQDADLMYLINSSQVRNVALSNEQIRLFEDFVRENSVKDRTALGNVQAKGYASPDGPVDFNDKLSRARSESGRDAISKKLEGVNTAYDADAYGEDWEGFRELVAASNIPDKDLILQVLHLYSSPIQRDQEIKNMSQVFEVLKTDILPQLRRTKLVASADITGKTDNELRDAVTNNINSLNLEEMLFAATLFEDNVSKAKAYKAAADKFNDVRAHNNYGVVLAQQGNVEEGKAAIKKAAGMSSDPAISNNLGVIALMEGKTAEAKNYINALSSSDSKTAKALVAHAEGDYATAARDLGGYNLAVAHTCNGNLAGAKNALANENCAYSDYLKAQIAMREGDSAGAIANLKSAVAKEPSLKEAARKDIEFAKLFGTPEFAGI